jgi:hypothetical protein
MVDAPGDYLKYSVFELLPRNRFIVSAAKSKTYQPGLLSHFEL